MPEKDDKNTQEIVENKVPESDVNVDVDKGTATYRLVAQGEVGGTYLGVFTFNCVLTPIAFLEADRDYRELLGKNAEFATTTADNVAYALAQLRQRVISNPPFWNEFNERFGGARVRDIPIIEQVFEAATLAETKYRRLLKEKHVKAVERLNKQVEKRMQADADLVAEEQERLDSKAE